MKTKQSFKTLKEEKNCRVIVEEPERNEQKFTFRKQMTPVSLVDPLQGEIDALQTKKNIFF